MIKDDRDTMRSHVGRRRDLRRRRGPDMSTLILLGMVAMSWIACVRLLILHRDLSARVAELEQQRHAPLPTADLTIDWSPWVHRFNEVNANLSVCHQRTDDLRAVLETLIAVDRWPGRKRLPSPVSDWKPWPIWGVGIGDIHDIPPNWDGTDESMLKWQARKKKRSP